MKKRLLFTYIAIVGLTLFASLFSFWINGETFLQSQSEEQYLSQAQLIGDLFVEKQVSQEAECELFSEAYAEKMDVQGYSLHLNQTGYDVLAQYVADKLLDLGYLYK